MTKDKTIGLVVLIVVIAFIASYNRFHKIDNCNVALIKINGYLASSNGQLIEGEEAGASSEDIIHNLILAQENPRIKAILISIDSTGGNIFAGEEIANALKTLTKPNVAVIRSVGLSSAYLATTGARTIYASPMSSVGDIGITASYLEETEKDKMEGYKYVEITSTPYKDAGNSHRPLSEEERKLWIESVKEEHKIFVADVAGNRKLDVEAVSEIADGTSMNGQEALDSGLIDGLGDMISSLEDISNAIGEKAEICWN